MKTIAEIFEFAKTKSADAFLKYGAHTPTFLIQVPDSDAMVPHVVLWADDEEKEIVTNAMKSVLRSTKVRRMAFIMEAWTAKTDMTVDQIEARGFRAKDQPEKEWVIYVMAESNVPGEPSQLVGHWIVEGTEKEPRLGQWVTHDVGPMGFGLFSNFLGPSAEAPVN